MEKAYRLAAVAVRERLAGEQPELLERLRRLPRRRVVVYRGSYDQAERVLDLLGVSYRVDLQPAKLSKPRCSAEVVFVNCTSPMPQGLAEAARAHVERGGRLVTSDWAMTYLVSPAFPGTLRWNQRSTGTETIAVEPDRQSLWAAVTVPGTTPQWSLWGSHPVEVLDPQRVRVEAASHDLMTRYGSPVVAASFAHGEAGGRVFHVISHFWHKRTEQRQPRHANPCTDFLAAGMRLSDERIEAVLARSKVGADEVSFAALQSAVTATELVARLAAG